MGGLEDKIEGKAKEAEGKITGDEVKEIEGKAQNTEGKIKQDAEDAIDRVRGDRSEEEKVSS